VSSITAQKNDDRDAEAIAEAATLLQVCLLKQIN